MAERNTIGIPTLNVPKPPTPSIADPQVAAALQQLQQQLTALTQQTQYWLQRILERVDTVGGFRGTTTFQTDVDANSKRITKLGTPSAETDAQVKGLALSRANFDTKVWDAKGFPIINLPKDIAESQESAGLSQDQVRAIIQEQLRLQSDSIRAEPYVTATASTELTAERQLVGEASVITITDGGGNSTITVSVTNNGISNAKLRDSAATSVIGRSAGSAGDPADIAASADNQVLGRFAGALSFSGTPTVTSLETTGQLTIGAGLDHNGTTVGFFGAALATQQVSGANLTNNVTAGGTNDQIDNFTDLTTYANDAATIRNDIYQLARKLKQCNDALRLYGLLT